jgi:ribosomal protein L7/L12
MLDLLMEADDEHRRTTLEVLRLLNALSEGYKIQAIKALRSLTRLSLQTSRAVIEKFLEEICK